MIDVLIPVLNRPANAQKVIDSLTAASTHEIRPLFICSPQDRPQIKMSRLTGVDVLVVDFHPGPGDFARKINAAFDVTSGEWVFQAADDVRFGPRWDEEALKIAKIKHKAVIGTNDLHNPAVKRRMLSTHTLFRRDYIETQGGTADDTGRVFCELYDHQFVDTEFCETAMLRNQWAFAQRSIVEHLHPHWGLAEHDSTYTKAMRKTRADLELYKSRTRYYRFRDRREARYSSRR